MRKFVTLTSLLSLFFMIIPNVNAAIITTGCTSTASCSLDELYNGGTIQINDVLFNGWTLNTSFDDQGLDGSEFLVTANDEVSGSLGLNFLADPALSFDILEYLFDFNVSIVSPSSRLFTNMALELLGSSITDDAFVEVNSDLDIGSGFGNGDLLNVTDVLNSVDDVSMDSILLASLSSIAVEADIQMEQFDTNLPSLSEFQYTFTIADAPTTTVPEPSVFLLLLLGMVGIFINQKKNFIIHL